MQNLSNLTVNESIVYCFFDEEGHFNFDKSDKRVALLNQLVIDMSWMFVIKIKYVCYFHVLEDGFYEDWGLPL